MEDASRGTGPGSSIAARLGDPLGLYEDIEDLEDGSGTAWHVFRPSVHAASVWGPQLQHGGPVAALLTRTMERCQPRPGTRITRITVDIFGAVPMSDVAVSARVERPGRRVELLSAQMRTMSASGPDRLVARASAWRKATRPTPQLIHRADPPLDLAAEPSATDLWPESWRIGFAAALDVRDVRAIGRKGIPTVAWLRLIPDLVAGEPTAPLESLVAISDVANGLGARLDPARWTFLNTDLSIHLFDPPRGDWVGLQAETSVGGDGIAMSAAVVHSESGPVGRLAQSVLVEPRK